jgi:hypothetical protein
MKQAILKNLENLLQIIKFKPEIETDHQFNLRRALLNSRFFDRPRRNIWEIISRQLVIQTLSFSFAAVLFVVLVAVLNPIQTNQAVNNSSQTDLTKADSAAQLIDLNNIQDNQNLQSYLQDLYAQGKIQYLYQKDQQTRVFRMNLDQQKSLDLYDTNPYIIKLINFN